MNGLSLDNLNDNIAVIAVCGGLLIALVSVIGSFVQGAVRTRAREQTRREVAAYVAEGSMSADEGERLLKAGLTPKDRSGGCC